jgi:hypothetical protein
MNKIKTAISDKRIRNNYTLNIGNKQLYLFINIVRESITFQLKDDYSIRIFSNRFSLAELKRTEVFAIVKSISQTCEVIGSLIEQEKVKLTPQDNDYLLIFNNTIYGDNFTTSILLEEEEQVLDNNIIARLENMVEMKLKKNIDELRNIDRSYNGVNNFNRRPNRPKKNPTSLAKLSHIMKGIVKNTIKEEMKSSIFDLFGHFKTCTEESDKRIDQLKLLAESIVAENRLMKEEIITLTNTIVEQRSVCSICQNNTPIHKGYISAPYLVKSTPIFPKNKVICTDFPIKAIRLDEHENKYGVSQNDEINTHHCRSCDTTKLKVSTKTIPYTSKSMLIKKSRKRNMNKGICEYRQPEDTKDNLPCLPKNQNDDLFDMVMDKVRRNNRSIIYFKHR